MKQRRHAPTSALCFMDRSGKMRALNTIQCPLKTGHVLNKWPSNTLTRNIFSSVKAEVVEGIRFEMHFWKSCTTTSKWFDLDRSSEHPNVSKQNETTARHEHGSHVSELNPISRASFECVGGFILGIA